MGDAHTTANRDLILSTAFAELGRLRPDVVLALVPMLSELAAMHPHGASPGSVQRTIIRIRAVGRWGKLRPSPECEGWTDAEVRDLVCEELASEYGDRYSFKERTLRHWIDLWNHVDQASGLSSGWAALIDRNAGRPSPRKPDPRGRHLRRSNRV